MLGLGLQVMASKHAQVCLSGKFLGPRHASACFSQHMARCLCVLESCPSLFWLCVLLFFRFGFVLFCCNVLCFGFFFALCVVLSFVL